MEQRLSPRIPPPNLVRARAKAPKPANDAAPEPSAGASLAIVALETERQRIAAELAAIDAVIERMRRSG